MFILIIFVVLLEPIIDIKFKFWSFDFDASRWSGFSRKRRFLLDHGIKFEYCCVY